MLTNEPPTEPVTSMPDAAAGAPNWATDHPLFGLIETPADAQRLQRAVPGPLRPRAAAAAGATCCTALLGWIGIGYAIVIVLAATFGPAWTGWIAVGASLVDSAS